MAYQFISRVAQLKILDGADEAVATVRSEGFAHERPKFEDAAFDMMEWADALAKLGDAARKVYTRRSRANQTFLRESAEVRGLLAEFEQWERVLRTASYAIARRKSPLALKFTEVYRHNEYEGGSAENVVGTGPGLLEALEELGDLSALGLDPAFMQRGRKLLDALRPERNEAWAVRTERIAGTSRLRTLFDEIVERFEDFAAAREFAMEKSGTEITDLGLGTIRAALAPTETVADDDPV